MADIHDAISRWHEGDGYGSELHEYLGMTWDQYTRWAEIGAPPMDSPWTDSVAVPAPSGQEGTVVSLHPIVALLAAERRRKGITQTACARAASVSKTCISEMENGHHEPKLATFLAYAEHIGYPYPIDSIPVTAGQEGGDGNG